MFVKSLIRSVATVTAVGSALAVAQVAGPVGATVTAEPEAAAAVLTADPQYPAPIQTTTSLKLTPLVQYGARNVARISVRKNGTGGGPLTGKARVTIANYNWTRTPSLSNRAASVALPRTMRAQRTYRVRATYLPAESQFKTSSSLWKFITVKKAITQAAPSVRRTPRGTRPRVNLRVSAATGIHVNAGRASVRLYKDGHLMRRQVVRIRDGRARATFGRVYSRGIWDVNVTYRGTSNFRSDSVSTWFRVTRR